VAKYLFCLPRFHTNAVPWARILVAAGHTVGVHAVTRGATESYVNVQPTLLNEGKASALIRGLLRGRGENEFYAFPSLREYWKLMEAEDPDVVIIRGLTRYFSRTAFLIAVLQRRRIVIYDQEDPVPASWSTWMRRAVLRAFGVPHVTSRLTVGRVVRSLGSASSLPFGPPSEIVAEVGVRSDRQHPRLLMVAKYRARKGHGALLQALSAIAADHVFTLTFCGEEVTSEDRAFCQSLAAQAESLELSSRISFCNNVPHAKMSELYRQHDVFVLPSVAEPAAVSPIEAAWNGCAVLISRGSGTRGYVPPGSEFEFEPKDPSDIARAIRSALRSPDHLQELRSRCLAHISNTAAENNIIQVFAKMIKQK
jgi:glycosyltransferase involved in cell wall biosynthesis